MNEYTAVVLRMGEIEKEFGGFGNIPPGHEYFDLRKDLLFWKNKGQTIDEKEVEIPIEKQK